MLSLPELEILVAASSRLNKILWSEDYISRMLMQGRGTKSL